MARLNLYTFIFIVIIVAMGCSKKEPELRGESPSGKDSTKTETVAKQFTLRDFYSQDTLLDREVNRVFEMLTLEERIGQMIVASAGEGGKPRNYVLRLIREKRIGSLVLLKGSESSLKGLIRQFAETSSEAGGIPLIFSCDAEPSLINSRISGLPEIIHTNQIDNEKESGRVATEISSIIKGFGFNQNYAPVCDLGLNREIIGDRSFGTDPANIIRFAAAFVFATQAANIVATIKHFPGHGNVKGDSHKELVYIDGEIKELPIFKQLIDSGAVCVMVGHIAIRSNKNGFNTEGLPSTLSRKIITLLLKDSLKFHGIVITDAMNMKAVTNLERPSLTAVKAGCDMILMPTDELALLNSIKDEISKDASLREQVFASVKRILRLKFCLGLFRKESPV